ncbi:radical SAM protein [Oceanidesulfovibrio marinus]|uniref:Radical SAM protein n=1 Tax=Oceanidesulfovibrio marinus TaxID=370038 RepID=A0A6P1ZBI0_9BACT|nr:radical SAM protein [Oceanidesulfovibrio marinus]TVM31347.1 radical SAM protein [Oceanidesulfovibrio marinus]
MASKRIQPKLVFADAKGNIYDHPDLLMLCRRGGEFTLPRPDELTPLPEESRLYLLPGRHALGYDPDEGMEAMDETAVAAFVCPGYTVTGVAAWAYMEDEEPPQVLPMFSYAAVGYANGRFYVAAKQVDTDRRQEFANIPDHRIVQGAQALMKKYPDNRLVRHLAGCALESCCPAARNLAIGRFEAPLPTSRRCNARCIGCISLQDEASGFPATQNRLDFTPTPDEILQIMQHHDSRAKKPIHSFGQGCEGEPLTEADIIAEAVRRYREAGGVGTVNVNSNGSLPDAVDKLAEAGIDSIRVSMNSVRPALYHAYYRPRGYTLDDVKESIARARKHGLFISLNFLFFPGVSDTEDEYEALSDLVEQNHVDLIQMRNLNIDPELYVGVAHEALEETGGLGPSMGFINFRKRLKKRCPWLELGYFNPDVRNRPVRKDDEAAEDDLDAAEPKGKEPDES